MSDVPISNYGLKEKFENKIKDIRQFSIDFEGEKVVAQLIAIDVIRTLYREIVGEEL